MDEWYSIGGFSDPMSSLSHLVGTVVFFVLSFFLLASAWDSRLKFWLALEFACATLLMLTMSFVYHMMSVGSVSRDVMLRLDVAAIFIMIASTFTVLHGILFTGWRRWAIISLLWTITVVGVTLRTIFFHSIPGFVGDGIFLLMGWIGAVSAYLLWTEFRWRAVFPIVIGGLFYTVGAILNAMDWPVFIPKVWGPHETFHFLVLAGVGTHWSLVWSICDGSFQRDIARQSGTDPQVSGHSKTTDPVTTETEEKADR
ncbi:MAG: hemolysin III family protein [Mariniblastus sp.]|nr:hemolysin III family protein [Mariniblastus sp.]